MDYLDLNPRQVEILEYIKTVLKDKGYTPTAVSYTHLDVYKRQLDSLANLLI